MLLVRFTPPKGWTKTTTQNAVSFSVTDNTKHTWAQIYFASTQVGAMAVVVDPIDQDAVSFYKRYDFIRLPHSGKMFLPMRTVAMLFS